MPASLAWFARQDEPGRGMRQPPRPAPAATARCHASRAGSCCGVTPIREAVMRVRAILLAAALVLAPLNARAADLTVWWEEGFYPGENEAVREMMAAFEHKTGKTVELVF